MAVSKTHWTWRGCGGEEQEWEAESEGLDESESTASDGESEGGAVCERVDNGFWRSVEGLCHSVEPRHVWRLRRTTNHDGTSSDSSDDDGSSPGPAVVSPSSRKRMHAAAMGGGAHDDHDRQERVRAGFVLRCAEHVSPVPGIASNSPPRLEQGPIVRVLADAQERDMHFLPPVLPPSPSSPHPRPCPSPHTSLSRGGAGTVQGKHKRLRGVGSGRQGRLWVQSIADGDRGCRTPQAGGRVVGSPPLPPAPERAGGGEGEQAGPGEGEELDGSSGDDVGMPLNNESQEVVHCNNDGAESDGAVVIDSDSDSPLVEAHPIVIAPRIRHKRATKRPKAGAAVCVSGLHWYEHTAPVASNQRRADELTAQPPLRGSTAFLPLSRLHALQGLRPTLFCNAPRRPQPRTAPSPTPEGSDELAAHVFVLEQALRTQQLINHTRAGRVEAIVLRDMRARHEQRRLLAQHDSLVAQLYQGAHVSAVPAEGWGIVPASKLASKHPVSLLEDGSCVVCGESQCTAQDDIVFCDVCNVSVHQRCYDVCRVPEGAWVCQPCSRSQPSLHARCFLCLQRGGALQRGYAMGQSVWVHVLCVLVAPRAGFFDGVLGRGPVLGLGHVPSRDFTTACVRCKCPGFTVACSVAGCKRRFHPYCARKGPEFIALRRVRTGTERVGAAGLGLVVLCEQHRTPQREVQGGESDVAELLVHVEGAQYTQRSVARIVALEGLLEEEQGVRWELDVLRSRLNELRCAQSDYQQDRAGEDVAGAAMNSHVSTSKEDEGRGGQGQREAGDQGPAPGAVVGREERLPAPQPAQPRLEETRAARRHAGRWTEMDAREYAQHIVGVPSMRDPLQRILGGQPNDKHGVTVAYWACRRMLTAVHQRAENLRNVVAREELVDAQAIDGTYLRQLLSVVPLGERQVPLPLHCARLGPRAHPLPGGPGVEHGKGASQGRTICDVCDSHDDASDLLVCGGCEIAVHACCYHLVENAVPHRKTEAKAEGEWEGQNECWQCRVCASRQARAGVRCVACAKGGGAMLPLEGGQRWVHGFCVRSLANLFSVCEGHAHHPEQRGGVETSPVVVILARGKSGGQSEQPNALGGCTICKEDKGEVLECASAGCEATAHPWCARHHGGWDVRIVEGESEAVLTCELHGKTGASNAANGSDPACVARADDNATCHVCAYSGSGLLNRLLVCELCYVAVHQQCYGVPVLPGGTWLCDYCIAHQAALKTKGLKAPHLQKEACVLCPAVGGALKRTCTGKWVHVLCALFTPETHFDNMATMEVVLGIPTIASERRGHKCSICGSQKGVCVRCSYRGCCELYHITCARDSRCITAAEDSDEACVSRFVSLCLFHSSAACNPSPSHLDHVPAAMRKKTVPPALVAAPPLPDGAPVPDDDGLANAGEHHGGRDEWELDGPQEVLKCSVCNETGTRFHCAAQLASPDLVFFLVSCRSCGVHTHPSCYSPDAAAVRGQALQGGWKCAVCSEGRSPALQQCALCGEGDGLMWETLGDSESPGAARQRWVHSRCANWMPETYVVLDAAVYRVGGVEEVPKARFRLQCLVCEKRSVGACVQCDYRRCDKGIHPLCGTRAGLQMVVEEDKEGVVHFRAYCRHPRHQWYRKPSGEECSELLSLRNQLERVRLLVELAVKRERHKIAREEARMEVARLELFEAHESRKRKADLDEVPHRSQPGHMRIPCAKEEEVEEEDDDNRHHEGMSQGNAGAGEKDGGIVVPSRSESRRAKRRRKGWGTLFM